MPEVTDADHLFKVRYAKKLGTLLRDEDKMQRMFPFSKAELVGSKLVQAIDLEYEHGYTLAGNDAAPTLRAAISNDGEQAEVTPSQIIGRKKVGYRDLYRTDGAGEKAFSSLNEKRFRDLALGARRNAEISLLHGQSTKGIGVVGAAVSGQVITISDATWAPGIWQGARNMVIDVYQSDGATLRQGDLVVTDVDEELHKVTVTGTVTGITTGDIIYRDTGNIDGTFKECMGLFKIGTMTSGTPFGINVANHPLFKPNTFSVNGPLSMGKLLKMAGKSFIKGMTGTAVALIPSRGFEYLNEQISGARSFDASYKPREAINGVEAIEYHYQGGKLMVVSHPMVFEGECAVFPYQEDVDVSERPLRRIGSVDLTFELPENGGKIILHNTDAASHEIRCFTDMALFSDRLGHVTVGTGITYPS